MKKKVFIWLSVMLCISLAWLVGVSFYIEKQLDEFNWRKEVYETPLKLIYHDPKTNLTAVNYDISKKSTSYPVGIMERVGNYLVVPRYQIQRLYDGDYEVNYGKNRLKTDFFYVDLYELKSGVPTKEKSIDVKKIGQNFNADYAAIAYSRSNIYAQENLIDISVYNNRTGKESEKVTVNLDTEQVVSSKHIKEPDSPSRSRGLLSEFDFSEEIAKYGLKLLAYYGDTEVFISGYRFDFDGEKLKRENDWEKLPLLQAYPALKAYFQVDENQTESKLFLSEEVSDKQLVEWFYPADKNIFEEAGVYLTSEKSIDNNIHPIHSIEQLNQYYIYSPKNYEQTLAKEREEQLEREKNQQKQAQTEMTTE